MHTVFHRRNAFSRYTYAVWRAVRPIFVERPRSARIPQLRHAATTGRADLPLSAGYTFASSGGTIAGSGRPAEGLASFSVGHFASSVYAAIEIDPKA